MIKICALLQIFLPILESGELLTQVFATVSMIIYYSGQNWLDKSLCVNVLLVNNGIRLNLLHIQYIMAYFSDIYHATFDPASEVDVAMRLVPDANSAEPVMIERLNQYHR